MDEFKYKVVNNEVVTKTVLARFNAVDEAIGEVEVHIANAITDWKESEVGQWCGDNVVGKLTVHTHREIATYTHQIAITGYLKGTDLTYFKLKWGK